VADPEILKKRGRVGADENVSALSSFIKSLVANAHTSQ